MRLVAAQAAPAPSPPLGTLLSGTYRLERALDQGGMAMVYEAEHIRLGRRVAVKLLARHLAYDDQVLARFAREAALAARLEHPHLVQVLDYDTTEEGQPFIVMELLRGESLAARLAREGRLELAAVVRLVQAVALGLAAAHRCDVVHRDLKPANIFLAEEAAQGWQVKVLDFGISLCRRDERRLTGEYAVLGTPEYMAPEQAAGRTANVDERADQYSLAVITYEALCGHVPFSAANVVELLRRVISEPPPALELSAPEVPSAVSAVLCRALAKEPKHRFESVIEFSQALLAAAENASGAANSANAPAAHAAGSGGWTLPPVSAIKTRPPGRAHADSVDDFGEAALRATHRVTEALNQVSSLLARARESFGLGDLDLAVNYVESALSLAEELGVQEPIATESALIESVLSSRLGCLEGRLVVRYVPTSSERVTLRPEQAFLLSRIEGIGNLEDLFDLSPLPRRETLRHLVALLKKGVLGAE